MVIFVDILAAVQQAYDNWGPLYAIKVLIWELKWRPIRFYYI